MEVSQLQAIYSTSTLIDSIVQATLIIDLKELIERPLKCDLGMKWVLMNKCDNRCV